MRKKEALRIAATLTTVMAGAAISSCGEKPSVKTNDSGEKRGERIVIYQSRPEPSIEIPATPLYTTPVSSVQTEISELATTPEGKKVGSVLREVSERGAVARRPEAMLPATQEYPFGLWDTRTAAPSIHAQMEQAITERSFEINGRVFFLDNWSGVLAKTDRPLIFANTSLSVIPDEVSPEEYVYVLGIDWRREGGNVVVRIAQANPGHDTVEHWKSNDGFHWQRIR